MSVALRNTSLIRPHTPVAAWPDLVYGWEPAIGMTAHQEAGFAFPIRVGDLLTSRRPSLVLTTDYRACAGCASSTKIDVSYDLWLTQSPKPNWCGPSWPAVCSGVAPGSTIELMIWLMHTRDMRPAGSVKRGYNFKPPVWLNGRVQKPLFKAYVCEPCGHSIVSFVLSTGVKSSLVRGLSKGSAAISLNDFLGQALRALHRSTPSAGYLDGIEFGSEVAPLHDGGMTNFNLRLSRFCLTKYTSTSAPSPSSAEPAC